MSRKKSLKDEIYHSSDVIKSYSKSIFENNNITEQNKKMIKEFLEHLTALGLSSRRVSIYLRMFKVVGEKSIIKFRDIDERELKRIWGQVENSGYKAWTIETYKTCLKVFFRWLYGLDGSQPLPEVIRWLKGKTPPSTIKKKDLITQEEFERMVNGTDNMMERTMLAVFWETGIRPGELLNLTLSDMSIDEDHILLTVAGKMEKKMGPRDVIVIKSRDLILQWLEHHPNKNDRKSPLWIVTKGYKNVGKPASLRYLYSTLKKLAARAGIEKNVYPYILRHSRATAFHLMYGSAIGSKMCGHAPDSRMTRTYLHLDQADVLAALRNSSKPSTGEQLKYHEQKSVCPHCNHTNFFDRVLCTICGKPLREDFTLKAMTEREKINKVLNFINLVESDEEVMDIMENPEWQKKMAKKMSQIRQNKV